MALPKKKPSQCSLLAAVMPYTTCIRMSSEALRRRARWEAYQPDRRQDERRKHPW